MDKFLDSQDDTVFDAEANRGSRGIIDTTTGVRNKGRIPRVIYSLVCIFDLYGME